MHAGGGKQNRGVVFGDQGGRGDDFVSPTLKKFQVFIANFTGFYHECDFNTGYGGRRGEREKVRRKKRRGLG